MFPAGFIGYEIGQIQQDVVNVSKLTDICNTQISNAQKCTSKHDISIMSLHNDISDIKKMISKIGSVLDAMCKKIEIDTIDQPIDEIISFDKIKIKEDNKIFSKKINKKNKYIDECYDGMAFLEKLQ